LELRNAASVLIQAVDRWKIGDVEVIFPGLAVSLIIDGIANVILVGKDKEKAEAGIGWDVGRLTNLKRAWFFTNNAADNI
jgi:hypothetical protein